MITIFIHVIYLLKNYIYAYNLWLKAILYSKFFRKRIFLYNQNIIKKKNFIFSTRIILIYITFLIIYQRKVGHDYYGHRVQCT